MKFIKFICRCHRGQIYVVNSEGLGRYIGGGVKSDRMWGVNIYGMGTSTYKELDSNRKELDNLDIDISTLLVHILT